MTAPDDPRTDGEITRGRGRPFERGNPGKPHGAKHRITRAIEKLMAGEAEEITRRVIEAAKDGDMTAIRLVLDRVAPAPRERLIEFDMPEITGAADLPAAVLSIMTAVAKGDLTPGEATQLAGVLEHYRRHSETADLEARIKALEVVNAHRT